MLIMCLLHYGLYCVSICDVEDLCISVTFCLLSTIFLGHMVSISDWRGSFGSLYRIVLGAVCDVIILLQGVMCVVKQLNV